jgi:hypothetical protein
VTRIYRQRDAETAAAGEDKSKPQDSDEVSGNESTSDDESTAADGAPVASKKRNAVQVEAPSKGQPVPPRKQRKTAAVGEATAGQTHGSSVGGFAALFQAQLATLQPDTQTVLCCGSSCDGIISVSGCHSCSFCKRVQHAHCGVAIGEEGSGQMVNCKSADCVSLR